MPTLSEESLARSNAALELGLSGEIGHEEAVAAALAIEPSNAGAWIVLGGIRLKTDLASAQECFWKAIRLTPTRATPYLLLVGACEQQAAELGLALTILGLEAASVARAVPEAVLDLIPVLFPKSKAFELDFSDPAMLAAAAAEMKKSTGLESESAHVTAQLRPFRWLIALCGDGDGVDAEALIAEGRAHAREYEPVLRAALSDTLTYALGIHSMAACRLTAMLGEIGSEESLADIVELAGADDLNIGLHAQWSLWRMGQRFPQQTAAALATDDAQSEEHWSDIADQLYMLPAGTDVTLAATRFSEKIRAKPKGMDVDYALAVLQRALSRHGADPELQRSVAALEKRLPPKARQSYEEALHADPFQPQLVEDGMRHQEIHAVLLGDVWNEEWADDDAFDEDDEYFDEDESDDDEFDEPSPYAEAFAVPAPPAPKIGRNDPCWCASGKKYKKCHLAEDEEKARQGYATTSTAKPSVPEPPHLRLRDRMTEELMQRAGKAALLAALGNYWGGSSIGEEMNDTDHACFIDWLLFDFRMPNGKTPCEDYRDRHRLQLTIKELAQIEAWIRARFGMWEVQRVDSGVGMLVKNLATEEELFVNDVASTKQLVRWDVMLQRVERHDAQNMFVGHGYTVPRNLLPGMWAWIDETCQRTGQDRAAAIISSSHELHRALKKLHEASVRNVRIENFDGDLMEFGEAAYTVIAAAEVQALLRAQPDVNESDLDGEPVFRRTLPNKRDHEDTTLATLVFEEGKLLLRCNSRKRLLAQRKWLEKLAGTRLAHLHDSFQSVEEARRQAKEDPAFQERPEPPGEQEREILQRYQDEHNAKWIDMEVPALGGKTPRQASRSKAGRAALEELLRTIENNEARRLRETGVGSDFRAIRKQLNLSE